MKVLTREKETFPKREAFGWREYFSLVRCATKYRLRHVDPPYAGEYQEMFEKKFAEQFGASQSRLVSTGTSAIYIALKAIGIPTNSTVMVSGITDGGCISAIIESGFRPALVDTGVESFNITLETVIKTFEAIKSQNQEPAKCLVACHIGGEPITEIARIAEWCKAQGVFLIEDCSQAIKARVNEGLVGTFGQLSAFSIMYRKNLSSGGSGGVVLINDNNYLENVLGHSDRGKPIWRTDINLNNPAYNLFPALNHNSSEFVASVALTSLNRLEKTNEKRRRFCTELLDTLRRNGIPIDNQKFNENWAPFYLTLFGKGIDQQEVKDIANKMLEKFSVPLLVNYGCLASSWPWLEKYLAIVDSLPQARYNIENSFNLLLNEKYKKSHVKRILKAASAALDAKTIRRW